jgi:acetylornithine deacetylase/succinyl-diaminopimelate desuccinylase-like protein
MCESRRTWYRVWTLATFVTFGLAAAPAHAQVEISDQDRALAREIYSELISIPSVSDTHETVVAAEMLATRLVEAGIAEEDLRVTGPNPDLGNLVIWYRGRSTSLRPMLLMAHLDVVPAVADDWAVDPFTLREDGDFFYGRGSSDNKAGAAILIANLIRYKQEGFVPERDIIVVITADEETSSASIRWLLATYPDVANAEFALNSDAGGGDLQDGEYAVFGMQASEKMYTTFHVTTANPGGHSSVPRSDNAIFDLVHALQRIEEHVFPVQLDEVTRTYFQRTAETVDGQEAADLRAVAQDPPDLAAAQRLSESSPGRNALLRTTCVPTRLEAGHADNALPRSATATVNCRIFPGVPADEVRAKLAELIDDETVTITLINQPRRSPASALRPELMRPLRELVDEMFGPIPIIPTMSTGATDGNYVRNAGIPTYGLSALFEVAGEGRAHGLDERIRVASFYEALEFWYHMVQRLSSPQVIP